MSEFLIKKIERKIRYYILLIYHLLTYGLYSWFLDKEVKNVHNILVIEALMIGDLIVATPVFKELRKKFPDAIVKALVLERSKQVLENNPNIDEIIFVDKLSFLELPRLLKKIGKQDLTVILHPGNLSSSLLALFSGSRYRVGCTQAGILNGKGLFLTHKLKPTKKIMNVVEQNLEVLKLIGINSSDVKTEIFVTKEEENKVKEKFKLNGEYVCINPCTAHKSQKWRNEKFAELINRLSQKNKIILIGDKNCENDIEEIKYLIKNKNRVIDASGKTTLRELFALVKQTKLCIGVDSATQHIAAALQIPTITLYGPGFPEIWKPWKNSRAIINDNVCTRCRQHSCVWSYFNKKREYECMKSIIVDDVLTLLESN